MCSSMARSGGATLAKSARLFPKASAVAASARSGLPAKVSHAGIQQAMRHLIAKPSTAGDSLPQAVSGASRPTAWLSGTSTASKIKALSAGSFFPSCMAANVGLSFAANAAAACHATAKKGTAVIPLVTRGLSTTTNPAAAGQAMARKGVAGIPFMTRGLSTSTKVTNPAAAGQATARKIPLKTYLLGELYWFGPLLQA